MLDMSSVEYTRDTCTLPTTCALTVRPLTIVHPESTNEVFRVSKYAVDQIRFQKTESEPI